MNPHSKYPKEAGIYKLTCIDTGKIYIGKSINISSRIKSHKDVEKQSKGAYHLQHAIIKYGWNAFTVEILEIFENFDKNKDNDTLLQRESYYIELLDSTNQEKGYNRCKYSTDRTGIPLSDETKIKIGNANRGRIPSDETREKYRQAQLGNTNKLGKKLSSESLEKLKQAGKGRKHSDETKQKMSQTRMGKKHSEESKEKMRKPKSEEARKNMGKSFLGRKHSEESKEKMRKAKQKKENI